MNENILQGAKLDNVPNKCLGQLIYEATDKYSQNIFQVDARTNESESFYSAGQRAKRVAISMQKKGISSQDVILICSAITLDTPIPPMASLYLGAKIVFLDVTLSIQQSSYLLSLVSPKMIFVQENAVELIEKSLLKANLKSDIVVFGNSNKYETFSDFVREEEIETCFTPTIVDSTETAIIVYSSGTTGFPKAICHSSYGFLTIVTSFSNTGYNTEVVLTFSSFYWITSLLYLIMSFVCGSKRVICGNDVDAKITFKAIEEHKITYMFLAPVLSYKLTEFVMDVNYDVSSVQAIITSGTPISINQLAKLRKIFKNSFISSCYGQSEVGKITCFDPRVDTKLIETKSESCGVVLPGVTIKVLDLKDNCVLGANQKGEICIKSDGLMIGYYKIDNVDDLYHEDFLRSGDVGYFDDDKFVYIVGREKEMFKYCSWRIEPSLIEAALYENPAVKECAVFGTPVNEEIGEVPTACIVLHKNMAITEQEIVNFLSDKLSDREQLRGGIHFIDKLPRTPTGKLQRNELKNIFVNCKGQQ